MLELLVNGVTYKDSVSVTVRRSLKNLCAQFSAQSTANEANALPVSIGQRVKVLADGSPVFDGFIERLNVQQSASQHIISISGRDRLCDVLDSSVNPPYEFEGPIEFSAVARQVLDSINLGTVAITDQTGGVEPFTDKDLVSAEVGMTAYDFLEPFARKRQFLLTSTVAGNLAMVRAQNARLALSLQRVYGGQDNNILSSSLSLDVSQRFNRYIVDSQLNPATAAEGTASSEIVDQEGEASDGLVRASRILRLNSEEDMDSLTAQERATFEANVRRANSLTYSATVQGHSIDGAPFDVNQLARVRDDTCQLGGTFLLYGLEFSYSLEGGSTTTLNFTYQDAFTLQAEQAARESATNQQAGAFGV